MTREEHENAPPQQTRHHAFVVKFLQIWGFGFVLAGLLIAGAAAILGADFVELPFPGPWLAVGLMALGGSDFIAAKVLSKQQTG